MAPEKQQKGICGCAVGSRAADSASQHASDDGCSHTSSNAAKIMLCTSSPCYHEDCATPFHQEISLGPIPHSNDRPSPLVPMTNRAHVSEDPCRSASEEQSLHHILVRSGTVSLPHDDLVWGNIQASNNYSAAFPAAAMPAYLLR